MRNTQLDKQEQVFNALKGINYMLQLSEDYRKGFKNFFRIDLKKIEDKLKTIGLSSFYLARNEKSNSFKFEDLDNNIEIILNTNEQIKEKFLDKKVDEIKKKKYMRFLQNYIIDLIKSDIEKKIEGGLKNGKIK